MYIKSSMYDTNMVYIVVFTNVYGKDVWRRLALFGNYVKSVFMTTDKHIAVVLCPMKKDDLSCLANELSPVWLKIDKVSDDIIEEMKVKSNVRMAEYLLDSNFIPPPSNQRHLLQPLCDNAGLTMDHVAGSYSVKQAVMLFQYAAACGLAAIGVI